MVDTTYVTFLDADDEVLSDGVRRSIELLEADDTLAVAAGRVMGFVGDGEAKLLPQTYTDVNTRTLLVTGYGPWPPGAAVQRTTLMREAESAEPEALRPRFAEDYELLIRMSLVGGIVRHDVPSMRYEMAGGKSAKSASSALASKEAIREHYARSLGIEIELMTPMRMRAAANKRVARAKALAQDTWGARRHMLMAYAYGALSLVQSPRKTRESAQRSEARNPDQDRAIVVMESTTRPPDGTTRYIDQVVAHANPRTAFRYFSWKSAFRGDYDVLHVHWPEIFVRKSTGARRVISSLLLTLLILVLRVRRVPIVRTLHNLTPHEPGGAVERFVLSLLDRATTVFVTINPVTVAPRGHVIYIPHGHYHERFASIVKQKSEPGRLVYAGLIRPYKGIERLVGSFEALQDSSTASLRIVGKPTADLKQFVESATSRDPRVSAILEFVPDEVLVAEITRAELVCLPYDELHNSGMALVALSLNRPLLVPDTETTRALAEEVGPGWIHFFAGPLDAAKLASAIQENRRSLGTRGDRPRLNDRDWELVGSRYDAAFRSTMRRQRRAART